MNRWYPHESLLVLSKRSMLLLHSNASDPHLWEEGFDCVETEGGD